MQPLSCQEWAFARDKGQPRRKFEGRAIDFRTDLFGVVVCLFIASEARLIHLPDAAWIVTAAWPPCNGVAWLRLMLIERQARINYNQSFVIRPVNRAGLAS